MESPAKLGRIMEIAAEYEIPVLEDAAEALAVQPTRKAMVHSKFQVIKF